MIAYTLIDITETKSYRSADQKLNHQQANFMTFFQTLCLRSNYGYENSPVIEKLSELGVGTDYKGSHNVWRLALTVDEGRTFGDIKTFEEDFDLVPVINALDETIKINNNVFRTADKKAKNITFKADDT